MGPMILSFVERLSLSRIFPVSPTLPMVHWGGVDSKDTGMRVVCTCWEVPSLSFFWYYWMRWEVRMDGLGWSHFDPS